MALCLLRLGSAGVWMCDTGAEKEKRELGLLCQIFVLPQILTFISDQKTFQTGFYEIVDRLLNTSPVPAVVFNHSLIDGQAAVHLKIKDRLSLFIGEQAVLHESGNKVFL